MVTMLLGIRYLGIKIPDNIDIINAIENPIHIADVVDLVYTAMHSIIVVK